MATIDDFAKIEMKIGTILVAEYIEGADKLLRLEVDFGLKPASEVQEETPESAEEVAPQASHDIRQILSGIREYYEPEELIGKQCPFVVNLEPRTLRGLTSHGMILAIGLRGEDGAKNGLALLHPDHAVLPGSTLG